MQTTDAFQFGRKIFFLNPSFLIKTNIIETLRKREYEAYEIDDDRHASDYLSVQEDAILYINPGAQTSATMWLNLINTLKDGHPKATIGIFSEQLGAPLLEQLSLCNAIEGGIFQIEGDGTQTLQQLTGTLDALNAKGRRQYVRVTCLGDATANFMWFHNAKLFKARLFDLSIASVAILVESEKLPYLDTTSSIPCTIQLGVNQVQMMVKPLVVKQQTAQLHCIIYLIDRNLLDVESIALIRKYVFDTLKQQLLQHTEAFRQRQLLARRMELARKQRMQDKS